MSTTDCCPNRLKTCIMITSCHLKEDAELKHVSHHERQRDCCIAGNCQRPRGGRAAVVAGWQKWAAESTDRWEAC